MKAEEEEAKNLYKITFLHLHNNINNNNNKKVENKKRKRSLIF